MEKINMKDIAVFGAGGFGREVLTIIKAINSIERGRRHILMQL